MKLWNSVISGGLAVAVILCLCAGPTDAATRRVKAIQTASQYSSKQYLSGTNLEGRSGLFWGDTSEVAREGQIEGSAHMTYQTAGNQYYSMSLFTIPAGAHFGLAPDFELSAGMQLGIFSYPGGSETQVLVNGGAKYRFPGDREMPDFSLGGNVYIPIPVNVPCIQALLFVLRRNPVQRPRIIFRNRRDFHHVKVFPPSEDELGFVSRNQVCFDVPLCSAFRNLPYGSAIP